MSNYNQNSGYGQALLNMVASQVPTFGRIFVVMDPDDTDEETYQRMQEVFQPVEGINRFYTSLSDAYDATESNNNDVILLDANSAHTQAMLTVSKNRIHFIGMDGGGRKNSQGSKIGTPATDVAASIAAIYNTGTRNTYRNLKITQSGTNAAQINGMIDIGEGTYMEDCNIDCYSNLTTANHCALKFAGDTCHYKNCQFGGSTVLHDEANQAPLYIHTHGGATARYSYFEGCDIIQYSTATTASCIDVDEAAGLIGWIKFKDCFLLSASKGNGATAAGTMAEAVTSVATAGYLYFQHCSSAFATAFGEADASIYGDGVDPSANKMGQIMTPGV